MSLDVALLGYAAFAALASARERPRHDRGGRFRLNPRRHRALGIALLLAALGAAAIHHGARQALVAWIGLLSIGAVALVLLLSRWRDLAMRLAPPAALLGLLLLGQAMT